MPIQKHLNASLASSFFSFCFHFLVFVSVGVFIAVTLLVGDGFFVVVVVVFVLLCFLVCFCCFPLFFVGGFCLFFLFLFLFLFFVFCCFFGGKGEVLREGVFAFKERNRFFNMKSRTYFEVIYKTFFFNLSEQIYTFYLVYRNKS